MDVKKEMIIYLKCFELLSLAFGYKIFMKHTSLKYFCLTSLPLLINIAIIVAELLMAYIYRKLIYHPTSVSGTITDIIQIVGPFTVTAIMIIENLVKHKTELKLWTAIASIDRKLQMYELKRNTVQSQLRNCFIKNSSVICLVGFTVELGVVLSISEKENTLRRSILSRFWASNIVRVGITYVLFHLEWLNL